MKVSIRPTHFYKNASHIDHKNKHILSHCVFLHTAQYISNKLASHQNSFLAAIRTWNDLVLPDIYWFLAFYHWELVFVKVCVHYCYIFHQKKAVKKLWDMLSITPKKLHSFSRYSNICALLFPSFFSSRPMLRI